LIDARRDDVTDLSGGAALAAFLVAAATLVALHLVPSEADPVSEGVSAYALGPTARGYHVQAVASGVGALLLVGALAQRDVSPVAVVCLVAYGLSRIAIVAFPTDPRGVPMTATGRNHALLATVTFLGAAIAAPIASFPLVDTRSGDVVGAVLVPLAWLVTVTSLGSFAVAALPRAVRYYGIAQRAYHATALGWFILAAVAVATA
jgi:hypothetical protein